MGNCPAAFQYPVVLPPPLSAIESTDQLFSLEQNTFQLTKRQMRSAIPVTDLSNFKNRIAVTLPRPTAVPQSGRQHSRVVGPVYRLPDCDESDTTSACYFAIVLEQVTSNTRNQTGVIQCVIPFVNGFGVEVGRLQQNVAVTLHHNGTRQRLPATAQTANSNNSYMVGTHYWDSISQPVVSPGLSIRVNRRSGTLLTSSLSGVRKLIVFGGGYPEYYTVTLVMTDENSHCV